MKILPIDELNIFANGIRQNPQILEDEDIMETILGILLISYRNGVDDATKKSTPISV